jgi:hypothetical protein
MVDGLLVFVSNIWKLKKQQDACQCLVMGCVSRCQCQGGFFVVTSGPSKGAKLDSMWNRMMRQSGAREIGTSGSLCTVSVHSYQLVAPTLKVVG